MKFTGNRARWVGGLCLVTAIAVLNGCGHPVERKLSGRWVGESVENFDDKDVAAATGWAKGTSMEFAGSSLTVAIPAEEPRTGPFKIVKVHNSDVSIAVTRRDGTVDRVRFKLDDEHSIRWMLGESRSIVLRREM
ncbi:MAG: hypothetical protein KF718_16245 [Polyangiaceae bacterium]|nr:hypothetical protein [Polyangiaceae bacterium]